MPKSIIIEPEKVFARDTIAVSPIPVNTYDRTPAQEAEVYSADDYQNIWADLCGIREFETILNEIKTKAYWVQGRTGLD